MQASLRYSVEGRPARDCRELSLEEIRIMKEERA